MTDLKNVKCEACRRDAPRATQEEMAQYLPQIPEWSIIERDDIQPLERSFKFENFAQALAFTLKVGELAESEGHHPTIVTEWGNVTVAWWTRKIKGLHRNDFAMAAKTDALYAASK